MSVKTIEANTVRVLKCVERILSQIGPSHATLDFFMPGAVVDGGKDINNVMRDREADYRLFSAAMIIQPGNVAKTDKRTGGVRRQKYIYAIWAMTTLTEEDIAAGIDLRQKQERMIDDVRQLLDVDYYIKLAAAELGYAADFNGQRVSCIDHSIASVVSDNGNAYPEINFDITCEFDYDHALPTRT